jgi:3-hydroxyisobutyrate dehydrogenase-like beta-hydroxyacid dehydrogenase
MLKIGYIGLGLMGKPIVRNIMKAGYPVVVLNRSRIGDRWNPFRLSRGTDLCG